MTVGYGDISGNNYGERAYIIVIIVFGVATFSFGIAAFASILGTFSSGPDYQEKLSYLNELNKF